MSAIVELRNATRERHAALEGALHLGRASADRETYVAYARAMFGWLAPLEGPLWDVWACSDVERRRCKAAWLAADLGAAGCDASALAALPRCAPLVAERSPGDPFAAGVAYVVEGSLLGGQVLRRRLDGRLAPIPGRFLEGYGTDTSELWKRFVSELERDLAACGALERACAGARAAFDQIAEWFHQREVAA